MTLSAGRYVFTGIVAAFVREDDSATIPGARVEDEPCVVEASGVVRFTGARAGHGAFIEVCAGRFIPRSFPFSVGDTA